LNSTVCFFEQTKFAGDCAILREITIAWTADPKRVLAAIKRGKQTLEGPQKISLRGGSNRSLRQIPDAGGLQYVTLNRVVAAHDALLLDAQHLSQAIDVDRNEGLLGDRRRLGEAGRAPDARENASRSSPGS